MQRPSLDPKVLMTRFTDNDPPVVLDTQRIPKQPTSAEGKPSIQISVKSSLAPRFSSAPGNSSLINEPENIIEGSEERPLKPEIDIQKSTEQWPSELYAVGYDLGSSSDEDNASLLDFLRQKDKVKRTALVAERDFPGASFSKPGRAEVGTRTALTLAGLKQTGTVGTEWTDGTVWTASKLVREVKSADTLHNITPAEPFTPDSAYKSALNIQPLTKAKEATTPPYFEEEGRSSVDEVKSSQGDGMKLDAEKYRGIIPRLRSEAVYRPSYQADYEEKPLNKNLGLMHSFAEPSQPDLQPLQPQRLIADINAAPKPKPLLQEPSEIQHALQKPVVEIKSVPVEEFQSKPQKSRGGDKVLPWSVVEVKAGSEVAAMPCSQEPVEVQQVLQRPVVDIKSVSSVKSTLLPKRPLETQQVSLSSEVHLKATHELDFKSAPHESIESGAAPRAEGLVLQVSSKEESQELVSRMPSKQAEARQSEVRAVELMMSVKRFELATSALMQSDHHDLADARPDFIEDVQSSVISAANPHSSQASLSPQASEASQPQPAPGNSLSHTQAPLQRITEESIEPLYSTVSVQSRNAPFDSADPINFHNILNDLNKLDLIHEIEELAQAEPKPSFCAKWFSCGPHEINESHKFYRFKVLALSQIRLSPEDPLHSRMLQCFWRSVVGTQELVPLLGEHWRRVGFMDKSPYAELRECGLLSLLMLLTICNKFPKLTHEIISLSSNPDALFSWVAVGGRLTCMCVASLRKGEMNAIFNKNPRTQNIFSNLFSGAFLHWARLFAKQPRTSIEMCFTETKKQILKSNDRLLHEIELQMKEELR